MIYLQNIKFVYAPPGQSIDCTNATYAAAKIMIPYSDEIMNHDYIDSLACMPNEPKRPKNVKIT